MAKFNINRDFDKVDLLSPSIYIRPTGNFHQPTNLVSALSYNCSAPFHLINDINLGKMNCSDYQLLHHQVSIVRGNMNDFIVTSLLSTVILIISTLYVLGNIVFITLSK
jgi:hypothetical protein